MTDIIEQDELGEQLIELGIVPNAFLLDLNSTIAVPHGMELPAPWNLPSRLFRFPIEVSRPTEGFPRQIGLMNPLLGDHPFVRHVETLLGYELDRNGAPNEYGSSNVGMGTWWHAVDLITAGLWRELLDTRQFSNSRQIGHAVAYGLRSSSQEDGRAKRGYITTREARQIVAAIGGYDEPQDRTSTLRGFMRPMPCRPDNQGEHWPINTGPIAPLFEAWGFIHGIEDGWFAHDRAGHLGWTEKGRDRYSAGTRASYTETSGQAAFAF